MLVFEKSRAGRGMSMLPACDVEIKKPGEKDARQKELHLPQMSENDLSRHYTELEILSSLRLCGSAVRTGTSSVTA